MDSVVIIYISLQHLGERVRIYKKVEKISDVVDPFFPPLLRNSATVSSKVSSLGCPLLVRLAPGVMNVTHLPKLRSIWRTESDRESKIH